MWALCIRSGTHFRSQDTRRAVWTVASLKGPISKNPLPTGSTAKSHTFRKYEAKGEKKTFVHSHCDTITTPESQARPMKVQSILG